MITEITRDELKDRLDHPRKFVLMETLPVEIYRQTHLPGAINIPPEHVRSLAPELIPKKDIEVIVYCASATCHASDRAAQELSRMGYSNVRRYVGGKEDWVGAGLPVVREETKAA